MVRSPRGAWSGRGGRALILGSSALAPRYNHDVKRSTRKQETVWCARYEERLRGHNIRLIGRPFPMDADVPYFLALSPADKHGMAFTYRNGVFETAESADEYRRPCLRGAPPRPSAAVLSNG